MMESSVSVVSSTDQINHGHGNNKPSKSYLIDFSKLSYYTQQHDV